MSVEIHIHMPLYSLTMLTRSIALLFICNVPPHHFYCIQVINIQLKSRVIVVQKMRWMVSAWIKWQTIQSHLKPEWINLCICSYRVFYLFDDLIMLPFNIFSTSRSMICSVDGDCWYTGLRTGKTSSYVSFLCLYTFECLVFGCSKFFTCRNSNWFVSRI